MAVALIAPVKTRKARMARLRGPGGSKRSVGNLKKMSQTIKITETIRAACRKARPLTGFALTLAISGFVLAEPLAAIAARAWGYVSGGPYALYLAQAERDHVKAVNARMLSELTSLRGYVGRAGSVRDPLLEKKVSELESVIESATALGIFRDKRSTESRALAKKGTAKDLGKHPTKQPTQANNELAAILKSPARSAKKSADEGVGGFEEPCHIDDRDAKLCQHEDSDGALGDRHSSSRSAGALSNDSDPLIKRLNKFIAVLKFIPIGTPVEGAVTSGFGHRHSPFLRGSSFHYGVDVSLPVGSKVMATGAGRVVKITRHHTYGNLVDIQHSPGLVTRYAHLSRVAVNVGQDVKRGDVIAFSGNTGRSTGPHLHYEVIHNGRARNPAPFVQLAGKLADFVDLA